MITWPWSRLYIIEGCITVVWAAICIFVVPKNYETAYFLNNEEKALMRQRAEVMEAYSGGSGHYSKSDIKEAAKDIKSWLHGVIQIAVVTILYGASHQPFARVLSPARSMPRLRRQQVSAPFSPSLSRMAFSLLQYKRNT